MFGPDLIDAPPARRRSVPALACCGRGLGARAVFTAVATFVISGAMWWLVAPPQLGGSTSFVIVDGSSMRRRLQPSDLVVLRGASDYRVGDIVAYRSRLLHRVVLHRVVAIQAGRYTFKGDNNSFLDPERPVRSQLVGRLWMRVPSAGRAAEILRLPWVLAALAGILVLTIGLRSGRRSEDRPASVGA
jgi:signal peptidase I